MRPPTTLGARVALRRAELSLTQRRLAELCACTVATISSIECGENENVSRRTLEALSEHLRMSLDDLVGKRRKARR